MAEKWDDKMDGKMDNKTESTIEDIIESTTQGRQEISLSDVYVFVDESGSITEHYERDRYFIICLIFTKDPKKLNRAFRAENAKLAKKYTKLGKMLNENREIKGSDMTEPQKFELYKNMTEKCGKLFEIGIIAFDNQYAATQPSLVKARCFNYLIQEYMGDFFRNHCRFFDRKKTFCQNINFMIDERNVKTNEKNYLGAYLTGHLNTFEPICVNSINITYQDSKNSSLVQFADYIANTFLRNMRKLKESGQNVKLLRKNLCNKRIFGFPREYDLHI